MSIPQKTTYVLKVCVVGEGAVGKTSLIIRYTEGHFRESYLMTVGTSFAVKEIDFGDTLVRLQLWDLAGQPHFSSVRPVFYRGSAGAMLVYDVTRRESFDSIMEWYSEVSQVTGKLTSVLLANKVDLTDQRQVSMEEGMAFAEQHGWTYFETSAKDGRGVNDAFRQIAVQSVNRVDT
jgi:small GTP-binding protein